MTTTGFYIAILVAYVCCKAAPMSAEGQRQLKPVAAVLAPSERLQIKAIIMQAIQNATTPSPETSRSSIPTTLKPIIEKRSSSNKVISEENKDFWGIVNVDKSTNKTSVHVPMVFDMTNIKDEESGQAKLDLSVLSGLVTVNQDKARGANGTVTGPLTVTVFGIPVYSGFANKPNSFREIASKLHSS